MDLQRAIEIITLGFPGFLFAMVCHEAAHAYVALRFGDQTAKLSGRLTLNPMVHLDIFGTILFPLIGVLFGGVVFGWAKPVPVNPRYFKNIRQGIFWVSFAGPGMNLILGTLSAFFLALTVRYMPQDFSLYAYLSKMLNFSIYINFILAFFNLIPLPPLDGSKMVSSFLSHENAVKFEGLSRYGFFFFIFLYMSGALRLVLQPASYLAGYSQYFFLNLLGA